jgi:uncharacterized protein with NRDE domain
MTRLADGPERHSATAIVRPMCLLMVAWRSIDQWPLVVGANRDEWLDRPATPITLLQEEHPRILGGRDERAGGTWLAVNEHGVVCGLTNRPMPDGPDPTRQSRGRLPLIAARARTANEAAEAVAAEVTGGSYNPAWLLVGDRRSLHYLVVDPDLPVVPRPLEPGLHVLENAALEDPSVKVDHVRAVVRQAEAGGTTLWEILPALLADHSVPGPAADVPRFPDGRERMAATLAPCVHADGYGTRSSTLVRVAEDTAEPPELLVADGPPCTTPFIDAGGLWGSDGRDLPTG